MTVSNTDSVIIPSPLRHGDKIAIVSPAGAARPKDVYSAVTVLQSLGWEPYVAEYALGRYGTYSGTDAQRLSDLKEAILDPDTKAIICTRGGYGAVHLLDSLASLPLRSNAKWIVGFSDISALHALMSSHGIASIHGPMAKHISAENGDNDECRALAALLSGDSIEYNIPAHELNRCGSVTATLAGGNMAVLTQLIDTPYDMLRPGTVLLIEDIGEPVYKIERMLYQLRMNGVLGRLSGLIVGEFTDYKPDDNYPSMEAMIAEMVKDFDYPVAFGVPVGHGDRNLPLVEGGQVRLSVTPEGTCIKQ